MKLFSEKTLEDIIYPFTFMVDELEKHVSSLRARAAKATAKADTLRDQAVQHLTNADKASSVMNKIKAIL